MFMVVEMEKLCERVVTDICSSCSSVNCRCSSSITSIVVEMENLRQQVVTVICSILL